MGWSGQAKLLKLNPSHHINLNRPRFCPSPILAIVFHIFFFPTITITSLNLT